MRRSVWLVVSAFLVACHHRSTDPRTLAPLVAVATVSGAGVGQSQFTGVVRARVESDLGFRVGGKIAQRLVDAGQSVRRGQPLARLDPADLTLSAAAQTADVAAVRARATQAAADLKRLEGLVELGAVSAQAYDQAKAAAAASRAQLAASQAQARVSANARDYAVLVADADGVVEETTAEVGQVVAAGQTVVKLAHAGPREAVVGLPETVRPSLGSMASGALYGGAGATFPARLRQLSQSADTVTRTFEARYVMEGAGAAAALGSTVTLRLADDREAGPTVTAPLGAIYDPGSGPGVWRVDNNRVRFQPVRLLSLGEETAEVSGLAPGLRIVALGADRLQEGETIRTTAQPGSVP